MPALLYLFALAVFAQGTSEFVLAGLLPDISQDLGVSPARAGLLTSGFALGMVVGALPMAILARRTSPRWSASGLLAVFVAAHAVGATTHDVDLLLASRVVAALAHTGFLAVTLSMVVRIVPPERHTRALAVVLGGTTLALVVGVPAGAVVGEALGWRATLWGIAALCAPALVAIAFLGPRDGAVDRGPSSRPSVRRELAVLGTRPLQAAMALAATVNAATFCSFTYLAVLATGPAGLAPRLVPALLAIFGLGAVLGVALAGRHGDRHGQVILAVGVPALVVVWLLSALLVATPSAVWVLTFVQGALSFLVGSTAIARIVASAGAAPTLGGSFATAALNVGAVLGPVAGGAALATVGPSGVLWTSTALAASAAVLSRVVARVPDAP